MANSTSSTIRGEVDRYFVANAHDVAGMRRAAQETLRATDRQPRTPEVKRQREFANAVLRRLNGASR